MNRPNEGENGMGEVTVPVELSNRFAGQLEVKGPLREALLKVLKEGDEPLEPEEILVMMLITTSPETLIADFHNWIGPTYESDQGPPANGSAAPFEGFSPN